jgi:hypothetical protein|eukprot:COSAG03_NODE_163_length_11308_cov_5.701044_3_plen_104_part_00
MLNLEEQGGSAGPGAAASREPRAVAPTRTRGKSGWAESAKTGVLEAMARGAMEVARWSQDQLALEHDETSDPDDEGPPHVGEPLSRPEQEPPRQADTSHSSAA